MKIRSTISVLLLVICQNGWAQGFTNLNFEQAVVTHPPGLPNYVYAIDAIPGWTAYFNGSPQNIIGFDTRALSRVLKNDFWDTFFSKTPMISMVVFEKHGFFTTLLVGRAFFWKIQMHRAGAALCRFKAIIACFCRDQFPVQPLQ